VPPVLPTPMPPRRRKLGLVLGLVALPLLAAAGAGAYWLSNRADDTSATSSPATTTAAPTGDSLGSEVADAEQTSTTVPAATNPSEAPASAATTLSTATADDIVTDESMITADNPIGAVQYALLSGGKVYLRGKAQTVEASNRLAEVSAGVVGPDNVVNEHVIDPSVPLDIPGPLYVEDVILFGFNSVKVESAFLPILDLGLLLMTQNPKVTITVITRTDAVGDEATNLDVARRRGEAVVDYMESKGIERSRFVVDPRGEADASDGADPKAAALDRRAEFIISGMYD
jgi:outer membrane protein OmpA-like peptidoglycan-associated protein